MRFDLHPGNAFGCNINAHRRDWAGQVCESAASWNCSARQEFREDYCASGDARCYHIHAFDEAGPSLVIDDNGGSWLLGVEPAALDDQLLLLWGPKAAEPRGAVEPRMSVLFGAYRVRSVEARPRAGYKEWAVHPYPNGWVRFTFLKERIGVPRWESLSGPYLKQVDRSAVERVFEQALDFARGTTRDHAVHIERLKAFARELPAWLDSAAAKANALRQRHPGMAPASVATGAPAPDHRPLRNIGRTLGPLVKTPDAAASASVATSSAKAAPNAEPARSMSLVEPHAQERIATRHGEPVLTAVTVGLMTKPLLVLRGSPGVGKSDLAASLIDDPNRERTVVVVVEPTWRGREDLFGHVNPIDSVFEPTPATHFLRTAADAWERGDRRMRIMIFEEFNLSQPEYWLGEILVRSQYPEQSRRERTIELGGKSVRGWPQDHATRVFLSPALRIVATINNDHTVRTLSPRVLDRAAVVELRVQPNAALERVGLELEKPELEAIANLDFKLRQRGAVFSYRTAESLKACLGRLAEMNLQRANSIDMVLAQEVLSKVRLLASDPADHRLCEELVEWTEVDGKGLLECQRLINAWKEALENGQDVQQA